MGELGLVVRGVVEAALPLIHDGPVGALSHSLLTQRLRLLERSG